MPPKENQLSCRNALANLATTTKKENNDWMHDSLLVLDFAGCGQHCWGSTGGSGQTWPGWAGEDCDWEQWWWWQVCWANWHQCQEQSGCPKARDAPRLPWHLLVALLPRPPTLQHCLLLCWRAQWPLEEEQEWVVSEQRSGWDRLNPGMEVGGPQSAGGWRCSVLEQRSAEVHLVGWKEALAWSWRQLWQRLEWRPERKSFDWAEKEPPSLHLCG